MVGQQLEQSPVRTMKGQHRACCPSRFRESLRDEGALGGGGVFPTLAAACAEVDRGRGPLGAQFIVAEVPRVDQSGGMEPTPPPCCRVIPECHDHPMSAAIPGRVHTVQGEALCPDQLEQRTLSEPGSFMTAPFRSCLPVPSPVPCAFPVALCSSPSSKGLCVPQADRLQLPLQ